MADRGLPISVPVSKFIAKMGWRIGDYYNNGAQVKKDYPQTDVIVILARAYPLWYADLVLPKEGEEIWTLKVYGGPRAASILRRLVRELQREFYIHIHVDVVSDNPKREYIKPRTPSQHVTHTLKISLGFVVILAIGSIFLAGEDLFDFRTWVALYPFALAFAVLSEIVGVSERRKVNLHEIHGPVQWFWNILNRLFWAAGFAASVTGLYWSITKLIETEGVNLRVADPDWIMGTFMFALIFSIIMQVRSERRIAREQAKTEERS